MRFNVANRRVHYWLALALLLPGLLVVCTGLLLQVKKQLAWVQPPEQRGTAGDPAIPLDVMLRAAATVPGAGVSSWDDIQRIDVRPSRGLAKVWTATGYEVQVDLRSGAVLQSAYRRSDVIESLHDGSFFGDAAKLGLFLPAGLVLLSLYLTGTWMLVQPWAARRRVAARRAQRDGGAVRAGDSRCAAAGRFRPGPLDGAVRRDALHAQLDSEVDQRE